MKQQRSTWADTVGVTNSALLLAVDQFFFHQMDIKGLHLTDLFLYVIKDKISHYTEIGGFSNMCATAPTATR